MQYWYYDMLLQLLVKKKGEQEEYKEFHLNIPNGHSSIHPGGAEFAALDFPSIKHWDLTERQTDK